MTHTDLTAAMEAPTQRGRYFARSASDNTNDWPWWFVADREKGDVNVTAELIRKHLNPDHRGGVLLRREHAEKLAARANLGPTTP